jgi:signal transduction histidine kinase/ligand-binding sensor domain-containing protein
MKLILSIFELYKNSDLNSKSLSIIIFYSSLFLLLTSFTDLHAQPRRLQFKYLTPDDGLSSSIASCIIQDHKGLMWIGTANGLDRYDGFNFVVYKNIPGDFTSLADNVIKVLFEDHNKNLFIGSEIGLSMYDRGKDKFLNYFYDKSTQLRDIRCTVSKILEDQTGNLWLATTAGLIYFDRVKNKITQYTHDENNPQSLSNNNVEYILIDKKANFWVATRSGLNLFLKESGTFKHVTRDDDGNSLSKTIFINIAEDHDGNVWFGSTEGLYCQKNNQKSGNEYLKHYYHDASDNSSLSINLVRSLCVDISGNVWIGTDNGGLNLFNKEKQNFWHYRKDDYDPRSLNNEAIESIYQDKTGNLWFGTYTGGINIAISNCDAIIKYENLSGAPQSLSHNTVTCFAENMQGQIWVGTDGGGFNLFDRKKERFRRYNLKNSALSSNAILCIYEDSLSTLWMGTWEGGLAKFDTKTGKFSALTTKNSGILDDNIFAIAEGGNNDLWLGSFEHGLIHYQIKENKFTAYTTENSIIGNDMIIKLAKFSKGRILIGTTANFQVFSPENNHFITFNSDSNNVNSLSYPRVTDILPENDTCVWIGTPDGLNRFNPITGSFTRYYEKDGLPNSFIKGLVIDKSGLLWVSTNGGICRFDYKHKKIKNFVKEDGLQSNEFSERSVLKTRDGDLFMGGTHGFNIVYPEKISENKTTPDILITDFKIFNKSVKPGIKNSPLTKSITETESLTLSHKQSVLTFTFAIMDFSAPGKNKYAYMLENFDKEWIYPDNRGEATYTNLNPGKYVFRVKGSNNDGLWNDTGTSIRITILPPWWETWWFRLMLALSIVLLFTVIYLTRVTQLKKQQILLEKTVELKTKELKELNASKDKFFSIIAHDLKNPFSSIIGFSEMLKEEINSNDLSTAGKYATQINTSAVQTFRLLENLLEWANSQHGKISFKPQAINLEDILNEEFLTLKDATNGKNIELTSSVPEKLVVFADRNMIKTILRNLISNAIKFTYKNGKIDVKAIEHDNEVEIAVSDNGIGMTKDTILKLFRIDANLSTRGTENENGTGLGLFLCKEFVEKHGGKIWVESESGKGSVFKLILPSAISPAH